MKIHSLNTFYQKIVRSVRVLTGYTEEPYLEFLIKTCRLKPFDYIFNNQKKKVVLHREWFDEYGNSLILNDKEPELIFGDLELFNKNIYSSDIYEGLDIVKTRKISKQVILLSCQMLNQEIFFLSFLGIDDYLRTFCVIGEDIKKVSSLYLGQLTIKQIFENKNIRYFKQLKFKKITIPPGCTSAKGWISYLPAHSDFLNIVRNNFEHLHPILKD